MFIDQSGNLYVGDMRAGDREATPGEIDAWMLIVNALPKPLERIHDIEAPNDDNRKKITRQFMLAFLFKEAKELAPPGMTDAQVQAYLMAQGKGYAKLYIEEQAIIPWRELIP